MGNVFVCQILTSNAVLFKNSFNKQGNVSQNTDPALPKACLTSTFTALRTCARAAWRWVSWVQDASILSLQHGWSQGGRDWRQVGVRDTAEGKACRADGE